jgi:hypothetical protein
VAQRTQAAREVDAWDGERTLRWIVLAYVLAVVGGGLVALIGLWDGWW